jgi:hypothetical protein
MGWGDEIMVTAQARALQKTNPRPVLVIDRWAQPRWSQIWEGNPRILKQRVGAYQTLRNGPNARPYIRSKTATHWVWREHQCEPGEIYLTDEERRYAEPWRGCVLVEPNLKVRPDAENKRWPWERWQRLADRGVARMVQVGPLNTPLLDGVAHARTESFRLACAVLSVCRAYVGPEGGLHHAAAALGVPAVVLFGGFISPASTGYAMHRNLFAGGVACGARLPCQHCKEAMERITVGEVLRNLKEVLCSTSSC